MRKNVNRCSNCVPVPGGNAVRPPRLLVGSAALKYASGAREKWKTGQFDAHDEYPHHRVHKLTAVMDLEKSRGLLRDGDVTKAFKCFGFP